MAASCPSIDELSAFHVGRLGEAGESRIADHLRACAACEFYLARLDGTQALDPLIGGLTRAIARDESPLIPGYQLEAPLGRGAMGHVFRARQLSLDRVVALKVLSSVATEDDNARQRFRREANEMARLRHPHVVTVYDVGAHDRYLYFSMELCQAGTLAQWQADRPIAPGVAAELVRQLAEGVAAAHAAGIVHRDLKPANVLLTQLEPPLVKVSDFGIARRLDQPGLTQSGMMAGTPMYMAPEQVGDAAVGPSADIHALGAILYELLTGRPVFFGADVSETLDQVKNFEPPPPSRLQPNVPRDLSVITLKCLHKQPQARYATATELAEDLRRFLAGETIRARPTPRLIRAWKWTCRHPGGASAIAIAIVALVLMAAGTAYHTNELSSSLAATQKAEKQATQNADAAMGALNSMVKEVSHRFRGVPGGQVVRTKVLEAALAGLDNVVAAHDPEAPQLSAANAWIQISSVQWSLGRAEQSMDACRSAQTIARQVLKREPHSETALARLAEATYLLGAQQLNSGNRDAAQETYAEYAAIAEDWIKHRPDSANARWHRTRGYEAIAHAAQWKHDFETANTWFAKMQASVEDWLTMDPKNTTAQESLARAHLVRGVLAGDRRDPNGAKEHFTAALNRYEALAKVHPQFDGVAMGVQTCHYELGIHAKEAKDWPLALKHTEQALAMVRARHAKDPEQIEAELQLIDILAEAAEIEQQAQHPDAALTKYREADDRLKKLAADGRLANRPVYDVERRQQIDAAITRLEERPDPL